MASKTTPDYQWFGRELEWEKTLMGTRESTKVWSRRRRHDDDERGVVAAEFALMLPIIIMLLFAIVQMGVAFNRSQAVNGAAREGARIASLPTTDLGEACARVTDSLGDISFASGPTCGWSGGCGGGADRVVVTVTAQTDIQIPFWPGSGLVDLSGVGDFRCE